MNRHDLDVFSLLSGLVLTSIALVALFGVATGVAPWVWPSVLITIGVVVVGLALSRRPAEEPATDATPDPERDAALAAARAEVDDADHATD